MENREKTIYRTTIVGSIVNVLLTAFKFTAGALAGSAAMIADAVHSLSDFITDIVVLVFVGISSKPEDEDHDYGHGKYETLATTVIGLALAAVAIGIIVHGAGSIAVWVRGGTLPRPGKIALWAALVSIVMKEGVFRYTMYKARGIESQALEANAWHHRSDALSSIGTALGIGGAILLGERWTVLDPAASLVVGAFIIKVAVELTKEGVDEMMEKSLPKEIEDEIIGIVESFPDVSEPHNLRTRRIGGYYAIEMHIRMNGEMTLRHAHEETSAIESRIKERFGERTHVTIHTEPEKESLT